MAATAATTRNARKGKRKKKKSTGVALICGSMLVEGRETQDLSFGAKAKLCRARGGEELLKNSRVPTKREERLVKEKKKGAEQECQRWGGLSSGADRPTGPCTPDRRERSHA